MLLRARPSPNPPSRQLVRKIAESDVVVYVDLDPFDERKMDGVLQFVGNAAGRAS